ncbi:MAG TPA: hemerythrin domain-containing protein [Burkholderiaceae bacterium]|nr:hemerythrin domain-containing protein [Burkholderiaceae bacterium]
MASERRPNAREDLLALIEDDHQHLEQGLAHLEALDPEDTPDEWVAWVAQLCRGLAVHSQLEHELLYPAARQAIETPLTAVEAELEHAAIRLLVERLQTPAGDDEVAVAALRVLARQLREHLQRERDELIPQLQRAELDWDALLHATLARREELTLDVREPAL